MLRGFARYGAEKSESRNWKLAALVSNFQFPFSNLQFRVSSFSFQSMPHNSSILGRIFRFDRRFSHSEFGSFLSL
jgi:hypothetical protein